MLLECHGENMLTITCSSRYIVQIWSVLYMYVILYNVHVLLKAGLLELGFYENILQTLLVYILDNRKWKSETLFCVARLSCHKNMALL